MSFRTRWMLHWTARSGRETNAVLLLPARTNSIADSYYVPPMANLTHFCTGAIIFHARMSIMSIIGATGQDAAKRGGTRAGRPAMPEQELRCAREGDADKLTTGPSGKRQGMR